MTEERLSHPLRNRPRFSAKEGPNRRSPQRELTLVEDRKASLWTLYITNNGSTKLGKLAVKALRLETISAERRERLEKESRAAAELSHPNIARTVGLIERDGKLYYEREWLEGDSLADILKRGPLTAYQIADYGLQIAKALAHMHARKEFHCELNSRRIRIDQDGTAKVVVEPKSLRNEAEFPTPALTDIFLLGKVLEDIGASRSRDELREIVSRCLHSLDERRYARDRFQDMGEVVTAFQGLLSKLKEEFQEPRIPKLLAIVFSGVSAVLCVTIAMLSRISGTQVFWFLVAIGAGVGTSVLVFQKAVATRGGFLAKMCFYGTGFVILIETSVVVIRAIIASPSR